MSRIGKLPVPIPSGVKVEVNGQNAKVTGPKGTLDMRIPDPITAKVDGSQIVVSRPNDDRSSRERHGLVRSLMANMIEGVTKGYEVKLELYGTGYSADLKGNKLMVNCGFMGRGFGKPAQFEVMVPAGVTVKVETPTSRGNNEPAKFTVSGIDKQLVGNFASHVRSLRKPEPYKGKGFRYAGEQIRRKVGKAFASGG
ncbi:MAG: 50S ribosomal protein L6 [Phycisphaerales bacterium]|nr:50S ribosomal protein L6 [Phycisphaerales bacterium]